MGGCGESGLRSLRAIAPLVGLRRRLIVYAGDVAWRTEDEIDVLPFTDFAASVADGDLWRRRLFVAGRQYDGISGL